jgi:hypothetical protein
LPSALSDVDRYHFFIKTLTAAAASVAAMSSIFRFSVGSHQKRGKIAVFALARASAGFLDPKFTSARRTDFTVDQRARVRLLE